MTPSDLPFLSVAELAGLIARKAVSPVEVCEAYLRRIKELDGALNCYITLLAEEALAAAKAAEQEIGQGQYRGPLHGIPIGVKDNIATAGIRTTSGSRVLEHWVPDADATVIERLKAAGAIILGKLNLHEWARGGSTVNRFFGTTHNPWNLDYTPGGSSGGSGAAVAAGLCAAALGTDGRGSVRHPASTCGIVGLKPTFGRVSQYGEMSTRGSTNQIGPMARRVEDVALLLQVIAGYDERDATTARVAVPDYRAALAARPQGLRLGVPREPLVPRVSQEVEKAFQAALKALEGLGMTVQEVPLPHAKVEYTSTIIDAVGAEGSFFVTGLMCHLGGAWDDISPEVRRMILSGITVPASVYVNGQRARRLLVQEFEEALRHVDVIVTPTRVVAGQTIPHGEAALMDLDGEIVAYRPTGQAFNIVYNLTGQPAISVPCGFSTAGVPIGLQIAGRPFDEVTVLRVAHAYEQATPWHQQRPPL